MLNPSVVDLLTGVSDTLAGDVLGELAPGPARDELRAAITMVRKVARALDQLMPYLLEDIADLAQTLERLGEHASADALALPPASTVPGLAELTALDLEMREALAAVAERTDSSAEAEAILHAVLSRLTEREASLRLSPWER